jgi:small subunit ribosomal protein S16
MAVALRLMRFGKKGFPFYRVVALDKRQKRDGAYIEKVGTYDPMANPSKLEIDKERYEYWVKNGAQISDGLKRILKNRK